MAVEIKMTSELSKPSLVMCVYGQGGVGKTTLGSTAPKPVFIDAEESSKALGARGINVAVANVKSWKDVQDAWVEILKSDYQTVIIDPIDAFLGLLIDEVKGSGDMSLRLWGVAKERMRRFVWSVKSSGKHVVFIAHETKDKDDEKILRSPKLSANLSDELVNLCDVVGHLRIGEGGKRELLVQPKEKYTAKDRFDALGDIVKDPNITKMIASVHAAYDKPPFESNK